MIDRTQFTVTQLCGMLGSNIAVACGSYLAISGDEFWPYGFLCLIFVIIGAIGYSISSELYNELAEEFDCSVGLMVKMAEPPARIKLGKHGCVLYVQKSLEGYSVLNLDGTLCLDPVEGELRPYDDDGKYIFGDLHFAVRYALQYLTNIEPEVKLSTDEQQ